MHLHSPSLVPAAGAAAAHFAANGYDAEPRELRDIQVADLAIRRVRSAADIRELATLRQQINLAAAASADPQFALREKKETNWAWSSPSSCMTA